MTDPNDASAPGKSSERRCHRRVPIVETIELHYGDDVYHAATHDISASGIGLYLDDPPLIGEEVDVILELSDDTRMRIESVVVRVGEVVGLRFLDLEPHETLQLCTFTASRDPRPS